MRDSNRLTAVAVAKTTKPGRYGDGGGLWLQVTPAGTKSWLLRYQKEGRARQMGLGPVSLVSLADARERARDARRLLLDGFDPIEHRHSRRQEARLEAARGVSFRECADKLVAALEAGWRNETHRRQWRATLETYAFPVFGDLPVAAIDTALVMKALEPIWTTKTETASRVRGRVEAVLNWAAARGFREGENPARWKGHLDRLLPARSKVARVKHHAALPYLDLSVFMGELRGREGISARAFEFAILTAGRTRETVEARWSELDLTAAVWTVPGERMKAGREHRVPLSDRAVEILESLPREGEFAFIGDKPGRALSNMALLATLRRMGRGDLTAHGFRSTFRDWAAETTAYPSEVVEMALAHTIKSKAEAAYRRGDLFEKRRRLMGDWAAFCAAPAPQGEVIPIRASSSG